MIDKTYNRWIFGPIEMVPNPATGAPEEMPVARYYGMAWRAPRHHNGYALCLCTMNPGQLAKARQDKRLVVLEDDEPVPDNILIHHAALGTSAGQTLKQMLRKLSQHHVAFEPE